MTAAALVACAWGGCAADARTTREDPDRIQWEIGGALTGTRCDAEVEIVKGAKPDGTRSLGVVRMRSRARPLHAYEKVLAELARKRCAEGASIRQAVDDGAGVVLVEAALWERIPPEPAAPAAGPDARPAAPETTSPRP